MMESQLLIVLCLVVSRCLCQGVNSEISGIEFRHYLKASNADAVDKFGFSVALFGDTFVVGACDESSSASGVNGDQQDDEMLYSGAAYVFVKNDTTWSQQAYLKASNPDTTAAFGYCVAIHNDTIVVGSPFEDSSATGVNGDQSNEGAENAGAVYVFTRNGSEWSQQAYLKASNTDPLDQFGASVAAYGDTVIVGAPQERSSASGINGNQDINSAVIGAFYGAVYVFVRSGETWTQQAYLKASNSGHGDEFGSSVALYGDIAVVGAPLEDSSATGVNGDQQSGDSMNAGAAYVFVRSGVTWSQQAYLKASNTGSNDQFGLFVAIFGETVVVSAYYEDSISTGVDGDQQNNGALNAGASYVFFRSGTTWAQQAYLKASNTGPSDQFGSSSAIYGSVVLVGARLEASSTTGINGKGTDNSAFGSGAAYVYSTNVTYIKASNTAGSDNFGQSLALSDQFLIICAPNEDSSATGFDGDQEDNSAADSGACYVYDVTTTTFTVESSTSSEQSTITTDTQSTTEALSESAEDGSPIVLIIAIVGVTIVVLILACISAVILARRRRSSVDENSGVQMNTLSHDVDVLQNVILKEVIGKGAFGEVYLGDCDGTPCACKKLTSSDMDDAIKEARTLFKLSHPNIVRLIGIHNTPTGDTYLILEYVKGGSLVDFLPKRMEDLTVEQLVEISVGVAQGMAYLERKHIVHRDLAARNILISEGNLQPMISDFGLSRDNLYTRSSDSKVPVKWSAPEVLQQGACTSKSDVFSFGVTLWEIFSFAVMPFGELSNNEAVNVICNRDIKEKLEQPQKCPDALYSLMIRCWSFEPSDRPTFQEVLAELQAINGHIYQNAVEPEPSLEDYYN